MTLVEVMVALGIFAAAMLGFLGSFVQSRRVTEGSVMQAAVTSLVYGLVEQMKGLDYKDLLPSTTVDDNAPAGWPPPYIRVRVNQDRTYWLATVYTPCTPGEEPHPQAPTTTPGPAVPASSIGALDNFIGPLPLSSVTGINSQPLTLNLWVWVDEMPDRTRDVNDVKRITIVYTYSFNDGKGIRTIRDREVFIRTRFDQ